MSYKIITSVVAKQMMNEENNLIIDVRNPNEYKEGHIKNAVILPLNDIKAKANLVLKDKDQTILVYCRSGARSAQAAKILSDLGYTNVYNFGGILNWPYDLVK